MLGVDISYMHAKFDHSSFYLLTCYLVTLTLTLDRVILHTVMHHSSTSTYITNFIVIEETLCGQTDGRTGRQTGKWTFETHYIRLTRSSRPKNR